MKILVVGSTGVLGRNVIPRLIERRHTVRALVRRPEQMSVFRALGAEAVLGDILDAESLHSATRGCDTVFHLATAIPKAGTSDWSLNHRIRREGTAKLLAAAHESGVTRYLQQSIALMYGPHEPDHADETTPLQPSAVTVSAAEMEQIVESSSLEWCILRGGLFYGPGTGQEEAWRGAAQEGTLMLPEDGEAFISLVHVVDMARAVVLAAESAQPQTIYNVVDDAPVRYRELFGFIAAQVGANAPQSGGPRRMPSLRCSNAKLKDELGWHPAYPSYRSGLVL